MFVRTTRAIFDSVYPAFQLVCFLLVGACICIVALPLLKRLIGDDLIDHLWQLTSF